MASFESQNVVNKVERVKQLLSKGYIIVKLDYHEAVKTSAFTKWQLPNSAIFLYTTYNRNKTHWYEYWIVESTDILVRIRKSNRGNIDISKIPAINLKISDKELEELLILLENE
jgi:hypothetical protein